MTLFPHKSAAERIRASWEPYRALLPEKQRKIFDREMDRLIAKYGAAIEAKAKPFENDPLFMSMKLDDQERIDWIIDTLKKYEEKARKKK